MGHEMRFEGTLFSGDNPWDVVFDILRTPYREFWLIGDSRADIESAIPGSDSIAGNSEAVGIPCLREGRVLVSISVWEGPAPDGQGDYLGASQISAPEREVTLINVEGRDPGPVLVLQDEGDHHVKVWRSIARNSNGFEQYDIRLWPCLTSS